ncbi:tyrosine-type recombinase/integrase [Pseudomonas syringae]|nr:tyrosine-type recombinase/integrase [Pseudomonas syringae]
MADNLELQGGTWHVRLAIPKDVQTSLGGRRIFSQSLKTGSRREAMTRRLSIIDGWKTLIAKARAGTPLPADWQDSLADTLATAALITRANKMVSIGEEPAYPLPIPDPAEVARIMEDNPRLVATLKARIAKAQQTPMGLIKFDEEMGEMFKRMMVHRYETAYTSTPEQQEEIRAIAADPASRKPRSPITPARLKAFREFREGQKGSPKHIDQQVGRMERLSAFLNERSLPLDFDTVALWIRSIDRAPATLNQHLLSGSAFWQWAVKYDPAFRDQYKDKADPFKGHDVPQGGGRETAGEQREAYTTSQLETLYRGARDGGNQPLADLILLGAYTGSRIEQLCQLKVEHVIKEDGILSFNFLGGKNKAAKRVVPIHPAIRELVDRLIAKSTDGFLIPASSENQYGKRSHALSKAFGYLKKTQGFGPLFVFHSMRNTAITAMLRANVSDHVVMELVGHSTGTETHDTYSKGASAKQKLKAISKLPTLNV